VLELDTHKGANNSIAYKCVSDEFTVIVPNCVPHR